MHGENITSSSEQVGAGGEEEGPCVSATAVEEEEKVIASMRMITMVTAIVLVSESSFSISVTEIMKVSTGDSRNDIVAGNNNLLRS